MRRKNEKCIDYLMDFFYYDVVCVRCYKKCKIKIECKVGIMVNWFFEIYVVGWNIGVDNLI